MRRWVLIVVCMTLFVAASIVIFGDNFRALFSGDNSVNGQMPAVGGPYEWLFWDSQRQSKENPPPAGH